MARGKFSVASAAISSKTTTNLISAPNAGERIYVKYLSVDVGTAGSAMTGTFQPTTTTAGCHFVFDISALGHQEAYPSMNDPNYPGFALPEGEGLDFVTAGTTAGSVVAHVIYEVR